MGQGSTRGSLASEFRSSINDLRGNGGPRRPLEPEHYTDGKIWDEEQPPPPPPHQPPPPPPPLPPTPHPPPHTPPPPPPPMAANHREGRCSSTAGASRLVPTARSIHLRLRARLRPGSVAAIDFVEGRSSWARRHSHPQWSRLSRQLRRSHRRRPAHQQSRPCALRTECVVNPVPDDDLETAVCWNVVVQAAIRANLAARKIECDDVLGALRGTAAT